MKKIKVGKQNRALATGEHVRSDKDKGTLIFPFSSEAPVSRWFGNEILSHKDGAADLERLNTKASVLFNHDWDKYVGVVERAWVEDKRGWVEVRFSENEFAQSIKRDVENGTLQNVSFGYQVLAMDLASEKSDDDGKGKVKTYVASRWTIHEVSFVTVPADFKTVGVGRSEGNEEIELSILSAADTAEKELEMPPENKDTTQVDVAALQATARTEERARVAAIAALGQRFHKEDIAKELIANGASLDSARESFLNAMGVVQKPLDPKANDVDMSEKQKGSYSLIRALNAAISKDWSKAGFEKEVSDAIAKRSGRETNGFFLPMNVTVDEQAVQQARAAYNAVGGTPTQGGNLVATQLLAGSFIDILRNKAMVVQMGAQLLSGLIGNVAIPRQGAATVAYWVTENGTITEDESMAFQLVTLSPKTIAARSQITRQMLQQSTPSIEALVRNDLAQVLALGIDKAAIHGTGTSGQPLGILNQSGIGSVIGGTNGAAITIDHLIDLETLVASANADFGAMGYMTNAKAVGALKKLKSTTGQYLWTSLPGGGRSATPGEINGYPVGRTNQVNSNGTKGSATGVTSSVLFGNFSDLMIGEWGVLEILPNPYGSGFNSGALDIRAMQTVDVAVRHPESFAAMTDALT